MPSGFQPPTPGPHDARCVAYWPFGTLTDGNLFRDDGRLALHLTPTGLASPAYGLARTSKGTAYLELDGSTDYATMDATTRARFYANAPTSIVTALVVAKYDAPATDDIIFSCVNAGGTRGFAVKVSAASAERLALVSYDAAGAASSVTAAANVPLTLHRRASLLCLDRAGGIGYIWHDGRQVTSTTVSGSTNAIAYDTGTVPTVGATPAAASFHDGRLFAVALWTGWAPTDREARALCAYWRDGGGA